MGPVDKALAEREAEIERADQAYAADMEEMLPDMDDASDDVALLETRLNALLRTYPQIADTDIGRELRKAWCETCALQRRIDALKASVELEAG